MRTSSSLVAAFLLAAASAAPAATTTVKFCDDASDGSTYTDNRAASGWSFTDIGANDSKLSGNYTHPVKFKGSTGAQSASTPSGSYLTEIVLGVWIGNTARTVTVTPLLESGSSGTAQTSAPSSTSGLIEMPFSFGLANCVTGVTVSIAASGNSTAYLYYATLTTETSGGGGDNHAPVATQPSVDVDATVGTEVTLDLADCFSDADGDPLTYALDTGVGAVSGSIWSFTPNAAGSFSAEVSAADPSGASATMALSVTATDSSGLLRATLLDEGFSGSDNAWANTSAKPGDAETDCDSWSFPANVYNARSSIKVGGASAVGWALSPEITLSNEVASANIVLSFSAAAYPAKTTKFSVSIIDSATGETNAISSLTALSPSKLGDASLTEWSGGTGYSEEFVAPTRFKLLFETISSASDKRLLLDSIKVTQVYDPNHVTLAAPTGLAASDIGDAGFALSWSAVPNAGGYEVEVLPAGGTVSVSGTGATVTGLAADTAYAAKVKALAPAGSTTYADSAWSAPVSVRTTLAGGLVRATLFEENFTNQDNSWGSTAANLAGADGGSFAADELAWSGALVGARRSCAAVGTTDKPGFARTRVISLAGNRLSGSADISFLAVTPTATAARKPVTVRAFAIDADTGATNWTGTVVAPKLSSTDVTDIAADGAALLSQTVAALPETFYLRFEADPASEEKQFAIDAVLVAQTYRPLPAPATPAPVAGTPTVSSVEAIWPEVAGAAGYAVELRDAATGERLALDAACTATNRAFGSLESNRDYEIRVRALGDGTTVGNSPWSAPLAVRTAVNPNAPAFSADAGAGDPVEAKSEKRFAVSATRGGAAVPVRYAGIDPAPAGAAPAFSPQSVFSWTPTDDDAGKTFTATFATDGGAYQTNVVFAVTARPPLAAPAVAVDSVGVKDAALSWNAQSRAVSYEVRLWTGTADYTKAGVCYEDFGAGVLPTGWSQWGTGAGWYPNSGYEHYRVKFTETGDTLVSKCHSAPVTELSFHTRSSSTTATSTWTLFASHGGTNETDWVQLQKSTITTASDTPISRSFESSDGYRRFKWEFTKDSGTLGLGAISATHAGAGPKFVAGFGSVAEARNLGLVQTLALVKLRPERDYFLEVTAVGEDGEKESAVVRFSTLPADKTTVLILR